MCQDSTSKCWYPAVIESMRPEPRRYKITTSDGIVQRKMQSHLKPFTPQNKNLQSKQCVTTDGTIYPYAARENSAQAEIASEQSNARTDK